MTETQTIISQNKKILQLLGEKSKPHWVKASVVIELTGWGAQKMRKAREDGTLIYKNEDGYWYDLNKLNSYFIKTKA